MPHCLLALLPVPAPVLVPAPVADAALEGAKIAKRGQKLVCPVCSTVYEDGSTFCGNDGSKLVPMN